MWKQRVLAFAAALAVLLLAACNQTEQGSSESSSSSDSSSLSSDSSESSSEEPSSEEPSSESSSEAANTPSSKPQGGTATSKPSSQTQPGGDTASTADPGFSWDQGGNYAGAINIKTASAPGALVENGPDGSAIDYSNTSQGYVMVKKGNDTKTKVQVKGPNGQTYQRYILPSAGAYYPIPLQMGNGAYTVTVFVNVSGNSYAPAAVATFDAQPGSNWNLYPNIYANYNASSAAVRKAFGLCMNAGSTLDKVKSIYNWIITNISYDYGKASSATSAYVPNPDSTMSSRSGICFDYAALMAAMCRAQGIPTKVVIGTTKGQAHAWNEVYVAGSGWIAVGVPANGGWKRLDATFGAVNGASYTENNANYVTQEYY